MSKLIFELLFKALKCHKYIFIFSILYLYGCSSFPKYYIDVDSISLDSETSKTKYVLISGSEDIEDNNLQFQEYAGYINEALNYNGYINESENIDEAQVMIFLKYGIGEPQSETLTYSIPRFGKTGIYSSTTYGSFDNYDNFTSDTYHTPSYGVIGYTQHTDTIINYFRYFSLYAIDLEFYRKTQKLKQLWETTVTSTGTSNDLRKVLPILVDASKDYIGTNTGQKVRLIIKKSDLEAAKAK